MSGARVRINGIDLYHEVHGTGRPLVVLHGGVLNAETCFGAMIPRLTKAHQAALIPFLLEGVGGKPELNQDDRIHPNPEGHKIVAENVWKHLEPVLRK